MRTLVKIQNRYRLLKTIFVNFPLDISIRNLEVDSYTLENGQSRLKGISIFNFDTISLINVSSKGFYHCIGLNGPKQTQIVLRKKVF